MSGTTTPFSEQVTVSLGDRGYPIVIRPGLLGEVGARLKELGAKGKVGVVTDRTVARLYARQVTAALQREGYRVHLITVPSGERAKTLAWMGKVLDLLVKERFERSSFLVALGGGVVGDLTGFAASAYLRGVPFVQVPTTVIAQVDSSVGGKTGVNHRLGKNLIGAFYQPRAVLIDPATLQTLPVREITAGLAEVIKYGVIADPDFFRYLERHISALLKLDREATAAVIRRSCEIKAAVVGADEREGDHRRILNYGHTIGHALEAIGAYRSLIHGEAVAIGMVGEASLAVHLGYCQPDVVQRIRALVQAAGLPYRLPRISMEKMWTAMQHDKKVIQGTVYGVWPVRIGDVRIAPVQHDEFRQWFVSGRRAHT
ncbi:MAG TPA: 3-dehydroquinate synthase [Nitrospiraceae bacterium]|nr:3-dehydroquinate synthase [Nitrospiraceae bacterium]